MGVSELNSACQHEEMEVDEGMCSIMRAYVKRELDNLYVDV